MSNRAENTIGARIRHASHLDGIARELYILEMQMIRASLFGFLAALAFASAVSAVPIDPTGPLMPIPYPRPIDDCPGC